MVVSSFATLDFLYSVYVRRFILTRCSVARLVSRTSGIDSSSLVIVFVSKVVEKMRNRIGFLSSLFFLVVTRKFDVLVATYSSRRVQVTFVVILMLLPTARF